MRAHNFLPASANSPQAKRIRNLEVLRDSIRANLRKPTVNTTGLTLSAASSASAVTGTLYAPCSATNPNLHSDLYNFTGGDWARTGTTFPNDSLFSAVSVNLGNGTDITANPSTSDNSIRFMTEAVDLELYFNVANANNRWRLKVDGEYVSSDASTAFHDTTTSTLRYVRIQWSGSPKMRRYEFISGTETRFGGVKCSPLYRPQPWLNDTGLKACVHGDSMVGTISDSATLDSTISRPTTVGAVKQYTGLPDVWASGVGSSGYLQKNGNTRSNFLERVALNVTSKNFDVIWEIGGLNDGTSGFQAAVEQWLSTVIAANPAVLIFLTGPQRLLSGTSADAAVQVNNLKKAAVANFPKNAVFLDNIDIVDNITTPTVWTNKGWAHGTGRVGATTANGNADLVRGTDGTHPSVFGGDFLGWTIAARTLKAIDTLLAAQ